MPYTVALARVVIRASVSVPGTNRCASIDEQIDRPPDIARTIVPEIVCVHL
jgi:hypothetical protein